jgi:hypothetical protein
MKQRLLIIVSILFFSLAAAGTGLTLNGIPQGIPGENDRKELRIYPNPAQVKQITLDFQNSEMMEIRLINIAGKELITKNMDFGTSTYTLQLDEVPNGIYFVRVKTTENRIVVKKLVVSIR